MQTQEAITGIAAVQAGTIVIDGVEYTGQIYDSDVMSIARLLFMDDTERALLDAGKLDEARNANARRLRQSMNQILDEAELEGTEEEKEEQAQKLSMEHLAAGIAMRVTTRPLERGEFAAKVLEIYPDVPRSRINYDPQTRIGSIRLPTQEIMQIVLSMLSGFVGEQGTDEALNTKVRKKELNEIAIGDLADACNQYDPTALKTKNPQKRKSRFTKETMGLQKRAIAISDDDAHQFINGELYAVTHRGLSQVTPEMIKEMLKTHLGQGWLNSIPDAIASGSIEDLCLQIAEDADSVDLITETSKFSDLFRFPEYVQDQASGFIVLGLKTDISPDMLVAWDEFATKGQRQPI